RLFGSSEPWMLIGSMVKNKFCDHAHSPPVRILQKLFEVRQGSVISVNIRMITNIESVILQWRNVKRQKPDSVHAQILKVIQLLLQPGKITYSIAVAVVEGAYRNFIKDSILEPKWIPGFCYTHALQIRFVDFQFK